MNRLQSGETPRQTARYLRAMRASAVLLAVALALGGLVAGAPAAASTAELVQHLDQLVAGFPGGAGLWISDPNSSATAPLYSHSADEPIITASLYKLAVLAEASAASTPASSTTVTRSPSIRRTSPKTARSRSPGPSSHSMRRSRR